MTTSNDKIVIADSSITTQEFRQHLNAGKTVIVRVTPDTNLTHTSVYHVIFKREQEIVVGYKYQLVGWQMAIHYFPLTVYQFFFDLINADKAIDHIMGVHELIKKMTDNTTVFFSFINATKMEIVSTKERASKLLEVDVALL